MSLGAALRDARALFGLGFAVLGAVLIIVGIPDGSFVLFLSIGFTMGRLSRMVDRP